MATKSSKRPKTKKSPRASKGPKRASTGANGLPAFMTEVLTLADAAEFLRVSEAGLKTDAAAGRVPGRIVAGEWRFARTTLLAWLSQSEPRVSVPRPPIRPPLVEETPEEHAAFLATIQAYRDEIDRATGYGNYAPE
jgi:hypothetical protein